MNTSLANDRHLQDLDEISAAGRIRSVQQALVKGI